MSFSSFLSDLCENEFRQFRFQRVLAFLFVSYLRPVKTRPCFFMSPPTQDIERASFIWQWSLKHFYTRGFPFKNDSWMIASLEYTNMSAFSPHDLCSEIWKEMATETSGWLQMKSAQKGSLCHGDVFFLFWFLWQLLSSRTESPVFGLAGSAPFLTPVHAPLAQSRVYWHCSHGKSNLFIWFEREKTRLLICAPWMFPSEEESKITENERRKARDGEGYGTAVIKILRFF